MTDKPNNPEVPDEKNNDLYDVFTDLRDSLAADEGKAEQISARKKKGILKGMRLPKFFKKRKDELPKILDEDNELEDASTEKDTLEMEERLAPEYPSETEAMTEDELPDIDEDPSDDAEVTADFIDVPEEDVGKEEKISRLSESLETDADHIRDIALEDYTEEELEEVDERKIAWLDFIQAPSSQIRWLEWAIIIFIGVLAGGIFIWIGFRANGGLRFSEPVPTRTPDPNVPIPASIQLPGGWTFRLGKGSLGADGLWEPYGAEWLRGTEICKWIALPWSTQLEAVIRTLEAGDPIELTIVTTMFLLITSIPVRK